MCDVKGCDKTDFGAHWRLEHQDGTVQKYSCCDEHAKVLVPAIQDAVQKVLDKVNNGG